MYEHNEDFIRMRYLGKLYQKYGNENILKHDEINEADGAYQQDEFIIDVDRILKELPEIYQEIIKNDFLCQVNENWWQNKYDVKAYLQLKNMAVKAFFHCLYI